jgi:hypothetical protein
MQVDGQRVAAIRPAICNSSNAGKSCGQSYRRFAGSSQGCFVRYNHLLVALHANDPLPQG